MVLSEIINNIIAGGLLGTLGQGVRVAVGLKKFNETNATLTAQGKAPEKFDTGRLIISMFIGFVAGAIGMLVKGASLGKDGNYDTEAVIMIIAIGYSGADFIEGVFNTYINRFKPNDPLATPEAVSKPTAVADGQPTLVADESNFYNTPAQG
jgi:hypothetical protein